ncbi:SDR family oxidoreductase [Xanthocytophaga flava]|uniref:SDR family oxidoreductase n=1 Tax=Xanthocytophaga flava TaxID=3048013 RepID=UPI0028D1EFB0|nr:SDR family oxidoreductase [Xanthocytophaga flavus]MDJ1470642.1 SDR family oxidoreductase [Xanthocytophaga flavus]
MDTTFQHQSLRDKRVVILGGSTGLGFATGKAAAQEGAKITLVSHSLQKLEIAASQLPSETEIYSVDLSEETNIRNFFEGYGQIDHLVYTAGENLTLNTIEQLSLEAAQKFFAIRYWGALAAIKYAKKHINSGGSITLTGGIASLRPQAGWGIGASICGAMDAFTRAMAVELAPIRVNIVSPGLVRTNLWNSMDEADRDGLFQTVGQALPVGRIGEADEVAQTYLYFMKQAFSTGQSVVVDGGNVLV